MNEFKKGNFIRRNRLLAALPREDFEELLPHLQIVDTHFKQILSEQNEPVTTVYFPLNIVGSIINILEDGSAVEVATVGNEGMLGLPVFLGTEQMPSRIICQVPGQSAEMEVGAFRGASQHLGPLRQILDRYTQALFTQMAQNAACNRLHSIEQRCARWLLMTQDRVGSDEFYLTQEFLSQMLGVRRAGVNLVATRFQREGLIRYSRGNMTILDRPGLEATACKCYQIIIGEYRRLLG